MDRTWALPIDFCAEDASLRALAESEEFRAQNSLSNPALGRVMGITFSDNGFQTGFTLSSDDFDGFISAVDADMRLCGYEQFFDLTQPLARIDVNYLAGEGGDNIDYNYVYLSIPESFAHTVAWLSERGYYDRLTAWRASVQSIRLTHGTRLAEGGAYAEYAEEEVAVFRDPALIRAALEQMEVAADNADEYWLLSFELPTEEGNGAGDAAIYPAGDYPAGDAYDAVAPAAPAHTFYLNPGNPALEMLLAGDFAAGADALGHR
jgi:hypothetical protein